jgi:transposase
MPHPLSNDPAGYAAFLAIDWADQQHVFTLQEQGQSKKESGTLEQKPEVIGPWVAKLRERFGGRPVAVGLEQSRGALIHALLAYDFLVLYPIHPTTVAKFREAFKFSGSKSDPLDTAQILEILTKHLDRLQPLCPESAEIRLLGRLVEDRRKAVNLRTSHLQALQASLKEYFPQALEILSGNLASALAGDFLEKWPDWEAFAKAKPAALRKFLHAHNLRDQELLEKILGLAAAGRALTTDGPIVESGRRLSQLHSQLIQRLNAIIAGYEARIAEVFSAHPDASLFRQLPGAGPAMAPRLLAFFGADRARYEAASNVQCFTGVAPVTRSSGRTEVVYCRRACPRFARQTFHEFARLSIQGCQWARN